MSWDKATAEHFKGTPEYFGWRSEWPVTTFVAAANTYDFQRQDQKDVRAFVEKLEAGWEKDVPAVTAHAKTLSQGLQGKGRRICACATTSAC